MSFTCGGAPITAARIVLPAGGAWTAELQLAADQAPTGRVELVLPGLSLVGSVRTSGLFAENVTAFVAAGQGGLVKDVPGQHYRQATARLVLDALCAASGEVLSADSDPAALRRILAHYQVRQGTMGQALDELGRAVGADWWVTDAGELQVGQRTWPDAEPAGIVLQRVFPALRTLHVALSDEALRPGVTFRGYRLTAVEHLLEGARWRAVARF